MNEYYNEVKKVTSLKSEVEYTEIREAILAILKDLDEDIDYEHEDRLVSDKVIDSFDLVNLVTELGEEFDVEITPKDFVEENFNSLDSLTKMIQRLMEE